MVLRHRGRNSPRSAHILEASLSHDTANHPAHQRHAALTPACFALPSGTAPRKCTFHQGRTNPHGTACDITNVIRHTVCPHTRSNHITLEDTSESSSTTLFPALHLYHKLPSSESSSEKLSPVLHVYYKPATSESSSEKLFPALHLYYKLATSESNSATLSPALHLHYKLATSESSSEKLPKRTLTGIRALDTRSPQRVAPDRAKTHSRLHFAPSTRTISAEGCAGPGQNALSPAFRALDTHDLRRGLRRTGSRRTLACISRPRRARSPQRVAPDRAKTHSGLHFVPSTRTISAEACAGPGQDALSPAFRALDAHDLRRGLPAQNPKRTLACISCPRHARSPQRLAPGRDKSRSRLHFAPSTRTISAEGCAGPGQIALSPAFRALDTHDLRRGLRRTGTNRALACISRPRHVFFLQRVAFRGAPAAPPPALREKVKKSER